MMSGITLMAFESPCIVHPCLETLSGVTIKHDDFHSGGFENGERFPLKAPDVPGAWLLGNLGPLRRDPLGFMVAARQRCGDLLRLRLGPMRMFLVSGPDGFGHVLQSRADRYDRATRSAKLLADVTGESLLNTNGAAWARRRRLVGPSFHPQRLLNFLPAMGATTKRGLELWHRAAEEGATVEADSAMVGLTLSIVAESLFSADLSQDAGALETALADVLAHTWRRVEDPLDLVHRFPTQSRKRFREGLTAIRARVDSVLESRRGETPQEHRPSDLLDALKASKDEQGSLDDSLLRNETLTMLMAGHETTAHALSWTLHLLSTHPEAAAKLREEAQRVLGDRSPAADDLPRLIYATAVFRESLRLFPTIWILERRAREDDEIGGFTIPKGSSVLVSPYVVHRHPDFWESPEMFRPERFLEEVPRPAYIPFGLGPHTCVGERFALQEALVILPMLLGAFELEAVGPAPVAQPGITLKPKAGILLRPHRIR
jgi:enediyne biosynthesis protein E7